MPVRKGTILYRNCDKCEKKFKRYNSKDTSKLCSKCWDKIHHKKNYSPVKRRHNKLINPPMPEDFYNREFYLPSSLLYLGGSLRNSNHEVQILDLRTNKTTLEEKLNEFNPDLVGLTCLFSGIFLNALKLADKIKEQDTSLPIVMGGIHPTIYHREIVSNCPSIDMVVLGEGEDSFLDVANGKCSDIDGFTFRGKDGRVYTNLKTKFIENIDRLFPDYNLIDITDYFIDTSQWFNPKKLSFNTCIPLMTSRSCPFSCSFCSVHATMGKVWRPRSPDNVVDEIEFVLNNYGENRFSIIDDNFTVDKKRTIEICKKITGRNLDIQFETPNGVSMRTLDEEVLDNLVAAGLVKIFLPIESGSDFIRNEVIGKGLSREKIDEVIKLIRKYDSLHTSAFFLIGMPEETHKTLDDTRRMIEEIDVNKLLLQTIIPFPGTKVYEQAVRDNLLHADKDNLYRNPDFVFKDSFNNFYIKPYELEIEDLKKFREKMLGAQNKNAR